MGNIVKAGIIGLCFGVGFTYIVSLFIPTTNLQWSLIAVSFASFFWINRRVYCWI
jgi:hypothetical protein